MPTTMSTPVFKILPTTQQYDWGKIGSQSKVAQLAAASRIPGFTLEDKPYAEVNSYRRRAAHSLRRLSVMDGNTSNLSVDFTLCRETVCPFKEPSSSHWRPGAHPVPECRGRKSPILAQGSLDRESAEYPNPSRQEDCRIIA